MLLRINNLYCYATVTTFSDILRISVSVRKRTWKSQETSLTTNITLTKTKTQESSLESKHKNVSHKI